MTTIPAAGYGKALRSGEFRAVAGAGLISLLGDTAAYLAVTVLIYQRTGSPLLAALTFLTAFAPYLLGGTLLSGLVDRLPPRRLLISADLLGAALIATVAVPAVPVAAVFAVLLALGVIAPVRSGQAGALVADVLPGEIYVAGRSLLRISSQAAQVAGAAAGGALIAPLGPRGALLADSGSFALSALVIAVGIRPRPAKPTSDPAPRRPLLLDSVFGVREVWTHGEIRRLLLLGWVLPFIAVAPEALAAPAVIQAGYPPAAVGWWLTAIPAGMIVGDILAVLALNPQRRRRSLWPLAATVPAVLLAFAAEPPFPVQLGLLAVSGTAAAYGLPLDQKLRDITPSHLLARTLTISNTGLMVGQGLGFAAAGGAAEFLAPSSTIAVAGVLGVTAVLLLGRWSKTDSNSRARRVRSRQ